MGIQFPKKPKMLCLFFLLISPKYSKFFRGIGIKQHVHKSWKLHPILTLILLPPQTYHAPHRRAGHRSPLWPPLVGPGQGRSGSRYTASHTASIILDYYSITDWLSLPNVSPQGWGENDRGVSFTFGADVVSKFLNRHDLDLICRAHQVKATAAGAASLLTSLPQVVEDGYEFFAKRQLVTLFSAPNYCGEFDNAGGMMSVDETLMCSFQVRAAKQGKRMNATLSKRNKWFTWEHLN